MKPRSDGRAFQPGRLDRPGQRGKAAPGGLATGRRLVLAGFLLCRPLAAYAQNLNAGGNDVQRQAILARTGEYCEKLMSMALNYVCQEKITETINEFAPRRMMYSSIDAPVMINYDIKIKKATANSFIYDYQMIKKGTNFKESRTLIEENGIKKNEKDAALKTMRVSIQNLVFGPVGFLSRSWQPFFKYELAGRDEVEGKKAIIISASPNEAREENNSSGRIWVDEADSSILKIEWEPKSLAGFTDKVESTIGKFQRKMRMTTIYGTVKNGIRFPSSQTIEEIYVVDFNKEHTKYKADYRYDNYRYFTVEIEVIVK